MATSSPNEEWKCGENYQYPMAPDNEHWESLLAPLLEQDAEQCKAWREEVANLLLFSGLFATVLAAFIVISYSTLQPDEDAIMISLLEHIATRLDGLANATVTPPQPLDTASIESPPTTPSILINALWFTGLVLSLTTSLVGIISLQWLTEHERYPSSLSFQEKFALFHMRAEGLRTWCVPQIFSILPLLLQLSLLLFFAGLIAFLLLSSWVVAIPVIAVIGIALIFLLITTVVPALQMFTFCLPLGGRKRVISQCPYKSPQSKAFQRVIIFSGRLVRFYFYFVKALNIVYYILLRLIIGGKWERKLTIDPSGLDFLLSAILEARNAQSWVSFDKTWLVLRDAYARCIFEGEAYINQFHSRCLTRTGPLYDSARGVHDITSEYRGDENISEAYFCLQDLSSSAVTSQSPADAYHNNQYLQSVLFSGDLKSQLPTFSDYLEDPGPEFLQDENRFIFLSRAIHLSSNHLRHFAELHVRIMNYLYHQSPPRSTKRAPPPERPTYPNVQLSNYYSMRNSGTSVEQNKHFDDNIYLQFSCVIDAFFSTACDKKISESDLLASFYGQPLGPMFQYLATQQPKETVRKTFRKLAQIIGNIKGIFPEGPGNRSDYFFYVSSFYIRSHWVESDIDSWRENDDVQDLLIALRTYANGKHNRNRELGKRLGIPVTPDKWWEFLNEIKWVPEIT